MMIDFKAEQTIRARRSIRTFQEKSLTREDLLELEGYMEQLENPFAIPVRFALLETEQAAYGHKLGTYGVIKGADLYIGAAVEEKELSLEALGYAFELLVLHAAAKGIGTCWLGGTFNKSGFGQAMNVKEGELFPCISPIGRSLEKRHFGDSIARFVAKSDQRKDWSELFFDKNLKTPLTKDAAGVYALPLEMMRLAPSAANKQPWRVIREGNYFHFYEARTMPDSKKGLDIQKVDMGIGLCHFHLTAMEQELNGNFVKQKDKKDINSKLTYRISWEIK